MGFPALTNPGDISHIEEIEGMPVPLTALVSAYCRIGTNASSKIHYVGGYVNAGFSGGAMVFQTTEGWTIAGIVTHKESVQRSIYRRKPETGCFEEDDSLLYPEPSGLIRFADFKNITNLIKSTPQQK